MSNINYQSGGVELNSDQANIQGDVVGRDKITVNQLPPTSDVPTLHQVPPPPKDFTGRDLDLAELIKVIDEQNISIVGLYGMGGVGKTTLALKLAEQLKEKFPEVEFFFDLRGMSDKSYHAFDAMAHVVHAYHPALKLPDTDAELRSLYLSVLYDKRALLLMDNIADRTQAELLLPPARCFLLITSRQRFHLPGLHAYYLNKLKPQEASRLLVTISPRLISQSYSTEPIEAFSLVVDRIVELCGYLPLALRLAGSFLTERIDYDPEFYVRHLSDVHLRLTLTGVDASLRLSYEQLTDPLKSLWRQLAIFPADFDRSAAAFVWAVELDAAQDALSELVRLTLLEYDPSPRPASSLRLDGTHNSTKANDSIYDVPLDTGRYKLHDLARLFAEENLSDIESFNARRRHAEHYLSVLSTLNGFYLAGGENLLIGLAKFDLEWSNIRAGQSWASRSSSIDDTAAWLCSEYANAGAHILDLRQHVHERIQWLDAALSAAHRLQNVYKECSHLGNLGIAIASLGDIDKATSIYLQQLELARAIHDLQSEGNALGNLGNACAAKNDNLTAAENYEQALAIFRHVGERRSEGLALSNLGAAHLSLGRIEQAITMFENGRQVACEIGDKRSESYAIGHLGTVYNVLGNISKAIELFEEQLTISESIGDRRGISNALGNLGIVHTGLGQVAKAIGFYKRALTEMQRIGDRRIEGSLQANLGLVYSASGSLEEAITCFEQQLGIARELTDRRSEGNALGSLGAAFTYLKEFDRAVELLKQQAVIARTLRDKTMELSALGNIGIIYYRINDSDGIAEIYDQIAALSRAGADNASL